MKNGLYTKLAWTGIQKNRKLYLPYMLTCIGMVMMCYIVSFLKYSPVFGSLPGGDTVQAFLNMGFGVMCVFSLLFLFYTNSFLIRRRKKEFGLYNILGMGKKNLALVLGIETLLIALITLAAGLFCGILFSKLAELGIVKILGGTADFSFHIDLQSIRDTLLLFVVIYTLLYLNTLRQLHLTNPIELLHSENAGEKPPKGNALVAIFGAVLLIAAYVLAVSIEDPIAAMIWFFVAVIMVIIATYLLFISGSVTICRLLQKNKKYYYKTNHFISVSSMRYRMKRNGAGLASICILCTMVLVMVSSTVCLYIGKEDSLRMRYPRNYNLNVSVESLDMLHGEPVRQSLDALDSICENHGYAPTNVLSYPTAAFAGLIQNDRILLEVPESVNQLMDIENLWQFFIISLEDYNRLMGASETLAEDEVMVYVTKDQTYDAPTLTIGTGEPLQVKKQAESFVDNGVDAMQVIASLYIIVPDFDAAVAAFSEQQTPAELNYIYAFDLSCSDDAQIALQQEMDAALSEIETQAGEGSGFNLLLEGVASERSFFYGMYGGLFFLGILLGIVFIFAAVLIIYYKQVSEGYEDQSRFEIMQKVGMTGREIRRSINSQVLTVFFLPLIMAGVHLGFAFPLIRKLLLIFSLTNFKLLILVTVCCYLIFALFYVLVYRATSRAYYSIVSAGERDQA
ncbi:MAG TPA: ABC transporter permease [Candidatus Fimenecus stercoravium]|nr:ABC transporter permease [Candidatus Fimenecus stercoravium]